MTAEGIRFTRHHVARVRSFRVADLPGVLDMLRYEGCTVTDWAHDGDRYTLTMSKPRPFTVARWESFGLRLEELPL